jgi:aryl-alcohol dehydrogenase-like predicted oxidoreductase
MKYTKLGRTELNVSIAGLGGGGHSRLGLGKNLGEENAINVVKKAIDLGINIFDTSAVYGTETALGNGLSGQDRTSYVISTKFPPSDFKGNIKPEGELTNSLEQSLRKLNTDYIDVLHLHAVTANEYTKVRDRFMPELIKAKEAGKIGWFGITEMFGKDTNHEMLDLALKDNLWDVIMVGYNLLNFSASKSILPTAKKNNVGTLLMFAVRNALSNTTRLNELLGVLYENGQLDKNMIDNKKPLAFLLNDADSIIEAAYRFCSNSKGIDVVLSGTSNPTHLVENVKNILSGPLSDDTLNKINDLFYNVDSISGD